MSHYIELFDFFALILWISATFLLLTRAWKAYNLDQLDSGKLTVTFYRYFMNHLDSSIMFLIPDLDKRQDSKIEIHRISLNRTTYIMYVVFIVGILSYMTVRL